MPDKNLHVVWRLPYGKLKLLAQELNISRQQLYYFLRHGPDVRSKVSEPVRKQLTEIYNQIKKPV